jgi:glycosyltransferase involved in cell wall biosynthesis
VIREQKTSGVAVKNRPRLAVVSPFLDKQHGTERCVLEWVSQLIGAFEIHVYSQRVEDLDLSKIVWHRIPQFPGPHLVRFIWWLAANRFRRGWNWRFHGIRYDLIFSPGPNCLDADVMSVHIVFADYVRKSGTGLAFGRNPVGSWGRLLHRKLYYSMVTLLERLAYTRPEISLIPVSRKIAEDLGRFYGRRDHVAVIHAGLDHDVFNPARSTALRSEARAQIGISAERFVLLLIGNDWRNKGLPTVLSALSQLRGLPIDLVVVGQDDSEPYRTLARGYGLDDRVQFQPLRRDVEFYYAAADAYAGPSLEDAFALPVAEAMACGLPVITSATAGVSEIITDGTDGLILKDPTDSTALAAMIRRLYEDTEFRATMGKKAAETTEQYTWERNGEELLKIFQEVLRRKAGQAAQPVVQEM